MGNEESKKVLEEDDGVAGVSAGPQDGVDARELVATDLFLGLTLAAFALFVCCIFSLVICYQITHWHRKWKQENDVQEEKQWVFKF